MAAALLALSSSYCYSEETAGSTSNAISGTSGTYFTWDPLSVLPPQASLIVNGVVYRYRIIKDPEDPTKVYIQNENAIDGGYLFREVDDWTGIPGNTITKSIPIQNVPIEFWGQGEMGVEGPGTIEDPLLTYTYRYDNCFNPLSDPSCPGYQDALYQWLLDNGLLNNEPDPNDPFYDEWVQLQLQREGYGEDEYFEEEEEVSEPEEEKEDEEDSETEIALEAMNNAITEANAISQAEMMKALTFVPNFNAYLSATLPGGVYNDSVSYKPTVVPDSKRGLRNGLAQQLLHKQMVESQYDNE